MKEKIIKGLCLVLAVYFFGCYVEIISKNTAPNPKYSKANAIVALIERAERK